MAESKENFTRTESVARWSRKGRAVYEAEREALLYDFFIFFTCARCYNQTEKGFVRGRGLLFLPNFYGCIFIVFAVLLCRAVLSLSYRSTYSKHIKRGKGLPYLGYVRTYGM